MPSSSTTSFPPLVLPPAPCDLAVPEDTVCSRKKREQHAVVRPLHTSHHPGLKWGYRHMKYGWKHLSQRTWFSNLLLTSLNLLVKDSIFFLLFIFFITIIIKVSCGGVCGKKGRVMTQGGDLPPPKQNSRSAAKKVESCVLSAWSPFTRTPWPLHPGSFYYACFTFPTHMKGLLYK